MLSFTVSAASERINVYNSFVQQAEELGLPFTVEAKPLLDVCPFCYLYELADAS